MNDELFSSLHFVMIKLNAIYSCHSTIKLDANIRQNDNILKRRKIHKQQFNANSYWTVDILLIY